MKKNKYLKKEKLSNSEKMNIFLFSLICILSLSFTVGYSALNQELKISGEAKFMVQEDIRIIDVALSGTTNNGLEAYKSSYSKNAIKVGINLKEQLSTVTYKVTIFNSGNIAQTIKNLSSPNDKIKYDITGLEDSNNLIGAKSTVDIFLTISLKDGVQPSDDDIGIDFVFDFSTVESVLAGGYNIDVITQVNELENYISTNPENKSQEDLDSYYDKKLKDIVNPIMYDPIFNSGKSSFPIYRTQVESIIFVNELDYCNDAIGKWDASYNEDSSVIGCYNDLDGNGLYEITLCGDGVVYSPENSMNLFFGFSELESINFNNSFSTEKTKNMAAMFTYCEKLQSINLEEINMSKVEDISGMFALCKGLTTLKFNNPETSNIKSMKYLFYECSNLKTVAFFDENTSLNTSSVTNLAYMFYNCKNLEKLNLSSLDTSNVTDMYGMFVLCIKLNELDLSSFNTSNVVNMSSMFRSCNSLISLDLSSFNTSNVVNMSSMFRFCNSLTSLDLSSFDTSKVTDMNNMFYSCYELTSLDLSSFNTSNVVDMNSMFSQCHNLTNLDLSSFNTSNVTDMAYMFSSCHSLTSLDLSSFNTSNVVDMSSMFSSCRSLTSLDLSSFNTSNVTGMKNMFFYCHSLTNLDLSSFNTSKVTDMSYMFYDCNSLISLDLSNFDNTNVTDMNNMFINCYYLLSIDLRSWKFNNLNSLDITGLTNKFLKIKIAKDQVQNFKDYISESITVEGV